MSVVSTEGSKEFVIRGASQINNWKNHKECWDLGGDDQVDQSRVGRVSSDVLSSVESNRRSAEEKDRLLRLLRSLR